MNTSVLAKRFDVLSGQKFSAILAGTVVAD